MAALAAVLEGDGVLEEALAALADTTLAGHHGTFEGQEGTRKE